MNTSKKQTENNNGDIAKWFGVALLTIATILFNQWYSPLVSKPVMIIVWMVWLALTLALVAFTQTGRKGIDFFQDSKVELLKVVWPSRQETTQMTLIIMVVVLVVSLLLWGIDSVLLWLVGKLTSLK